MRTSRHPGMVPCSTTTSRTAWHSCCPMKTRSPPLQPSSTGLVLAICWHSTTTRTRCRSSKTSRLQPAHGHAPQEPNFGLTERAHLYNDKVLVWSAGVSNVACRIRSLPGSQPLEARNEPTHHSCRGWPYLYWSRTLSVPQAKSSQDLLTENERNRQLHSYWSPSVPFSPTPGNSARHSCRSNRSGFHTEHLDRSDIRTWRLHLADHGVHGHERVHPC